MRYSRLIAALLLALAFLSMTMHGAEKSSPAKEPDSTSAAYISQRIGEFDQISEQRKAELNKLAAYVRNEVTAGGWARLMFICTHNSRRSHLSQVWAAAAARYYGVPNVECFSGGTEPTAFSPNAVAALRRAGIEVVQVSNQENPHYQVRVGGGVQLVCFSKKYNDPPNPSTDFCVAMLCSEADASCPLVAGAVQRVTIPYDDPKAADDSPEETSTYDARCAEICREMFYLFSEIYVR